MTNVLSKKALFFYSMPAIPLTFAGMPLYIHAPDYFANDLGVPLGLLGFILLALRFVDAIQDPIIGRLSDRYANNRFAIMLWAALCLVLSFTALFQPFRFSFVVWFTLFMLFATTSFSVLTINLNTIGGLWSTDKNHKTQITSCREGFSLLGLLLAVVMPELFKAVMTPSLAFLCVSAVLAVLMFIAMQFFSDWNKKHQSVMESVVPSKRCSVWEILTSMTTLTKYFFAVYLMSMLASSIPAILVLFFIRDKLGGEAYTGLFLCIYFLSGAFGMPLWSLLSKRFNKYVAWGLAMVLAISVFGWVFFLNRGDLWQYGVVCVLSGIAFGADLSLPPSMLSDFIQSKKRESDASLYFGFLAFLAKLALAIASVIAFSCLDWAGFKPGVANEKMALLALSIIYAIIPCLIKLCSMILLFLISRLDKKGAENEKVNYYSHNRGHHNA